MRWLSILLLIHVAQAATHGALDDVRACRVVGDAVYAATAAGVVRVDVVGRRVVVTDRPSYTLTDDGFAEPGARAIAVHEGRRYVGTWGQGVLVDGVPVGYDKAPAGREHTRVTALQVHAGRLFVGTAGAGLWALAGDTLRRRPEVPAKAWVTALGADAELHVATLAGSGPLGAPPSSALVRAYARLDGALAAVDAERGVPGLPEPGLVTLHAAGSVACAGGPKGLWIRRGAWRRTPLGGAPASDISSIAVADGRVWVGYFNSGLAVLEAGHWRRVPGVDPKVNVVAAVGTEVWVGTARGVDRIVGGEVRHLGAEDGLPSLDIHALLPLPGGATLVGTGRGAVILGDGPARGLGVKQGLPDKAVWAAGRLGDGRLLLATSSGLYHQSGDRWARLSVASGHLPDDWVTAITTAGDEAWVGTYNAGVVHLRFAGDAVLARPMGGGWVNFNGLTRVGDTLYAGTMDGLMRWDDGVWQRELAQDVTQVAPAGGGLWVATRAGLVERPR